MADLSKLKSRRKKPRGRIEDRRKWSAGDRALYQARLYGVDPFYNYLDYAGSVPGAIKSSVSRALGNEPANMTPEEDQKVRDELSRLSRPGAKDRPRPEGMYQAAADEAYAGNPMALLRALGSLAASPLPNVRPDHPGRMLRQILHSRRKPR